MPVIHFSPFELDLAARQLRLGGEEITLQPRVFDLLAYLVKHKDRVVGKDELLSALWPGIVVTDASLQRAVNFARAALRKGGLETAIRTHARRGYRFCIDSHEISSVPQRPDSSAITATAWQLMQQSRWVDAIRAFESADRECTLGAADLEGWAHAAQCAGALAAAVAPLERSAAAHSAAGALEASARAEIILARILLESKETAVAKARLRRAARLLDGLPLCEQHGHLEWMTSRYRVYEGDMAGAIEHARRTIEIGKTLNNRDLESIGLLMWGVALQASGETRRGMEMQDEAAAEVVSGSVSPLIGGIVYCGLIAGCCNSGDWPRAGQWTDSFTRWCKRSNIQSFHGACLVHRAEVFAARGELERAANEISSGDEILRLSAPWAVGDAFRLVGDLHLARGEFERAETAYRNAHEQGWDPHPGYAMLLHYRGQSAAALRALKRAAEAVHWVAGQRRRNYFAFVALIAALSGDLEEARATLALLDEQRNSWNGGSVNAQVTRARGELALATGNAADAIGFFQDAVRTLHEINCPIDAAIVQARLAECLARAGDSEGAQLELQSATSVFKKTGAAFYLTQCEQTATRIANIQ